MMLGHLGLQLQLQRSLKERRSWTSWTSAWKFVGMEQQSTLLMVVSLVGMRVVVMASLRTSGGGVGAEAFLIGKLHPTVRAADCSTGRMGSELLLMLGSDGFFLTHQSVAGRLVVHHVILFVAGRDHLHFRFDESQSVWTGSAVSGGIPAGSVESDPGFRLAARLAGCRSR